ncbi:hypothetical protein ATN88_24070 [Enterovibrio coralii]|uniref:Uncharacterized protein n=1 Tax=Enterovibrio coralii TaxID=294935 RepID=A0A135I9W2_9GAMM|nr:hypothetical protein ATN88_24070 [Enterovibrio coralii]
MNKLQKIHTLVSILIITALSTPVILKTGFNKDLFLGITIALSLYFQYLVNVDNIRRVIAIPITTILMLLFYGLHMYDLFGSMMIKGIPLTYALLYGPLYYHILHSLIRSYDKITFQD